MDRRVGPLVLWMARVAAVVGFAVVLSAAFRTGWTRISTDFPNYYIGAVAARHHDSLPNLYDWTWFARQMNYAGIENQLGGYVPQSPATMLPIIPIAGFPPLTAKRTWLVLNLILLLAVIGILARMTGVRWEYLTILLLCGESIADDEFYLWPILHLPAVSTYSHSLYVCAPARRSERLSMRSDLRDEALSRAAADLFRRQARLDERARHGGRRFTGHP